jgi:predicted kinase
MVIDVLRPTSLKETDNTESRMWEAQQNLMARHFAARKRKAQTLAPYATKRRKVQDQWSESYSPPESDADVNHLSYKKAPRKASVKPRRPDTMA